MATLGSALVSKLAAYDVYPGQLPGKALVDDADYAVTYFILPGEGPIPTNDPPYASGARMERVRVQLSVWSRTYAVVETTAAAIVRLLDRVSQATWGTVKVQSSRVLGWVDAPLEPNTSLFHRVIDLELQYDEVP